MPTETNPLLQCATREQLAALLEVPLPTLTFFAYGSGKKYKTFTIPKKSGGARTITAPVGGLLAIQKRLANLLNEVYPQPPYIQGFVKSGSILKNASIHLNKRILLNIDLLDFFPSITASRVIGLLRSKPFEFNNEVASTIAGLTCHEGSLPQGAATSPVLSNMICLRMDKALCALSKRQNATYSRYADDITFSSRRGVFSNGIINRLNSEDTVVLGDELIKVVSDNYFQINPNKTRLSYGQKSKYVTGVKVNLYPNVSRKYIRQLRSMLHAWEKYGPDNAQIDFSNKYGGGGKSFIQVVRGRLAHLKNIKSDNDLVYRRLYNRFVKLEDKGRLPLPESEVEELFSKVFVIKSGDEHGTGFILDNKSLITCDHVVKTEEINYFIHSDAMQVPLKSLRINGSRRSPVDKFDLIALPVKMTDRYNQGKSFESVPSSVDVTEGMACKIVGFPAYALGAKPHIMTLEVTGMRPNKYGTLNAHVDKRMFPGHSGSPVLNDKNQVIGVVQRGSTGDDNMGDTFLPIQEVRRFLK